MEIRKYDLPTDGLTWVGARDTCVSKNGSRGQSQLSRVPKGNLEISMGGIPVQAKFVCHCMCHFELLGL